MLYLESRTLSRCPADSRKAVTSGPEGSVLPNYKGRGPCVRRPLPFTIPHQGGCPSTRRSPYVFRTIAPERDAVTSVPLYEPATKEASDKGTDSKEQFVWTKAWYPVAIEADLDPARPKAITLLGRDLVLWRDKDQKWRCFADVCPHRLAPLSEGRIEPSDGTLMCSYHGWRFGGDGRCTHIPQADTPQAEATACSSARSAVPSHPTQVRHSLVWVWAENGPEAYVEAAMTPPNSVDELEGPEQPIYMANWFMRDLPYGFDTLAENVLDPSHVPFTHHGIIGNRAKVPKNSMTQSSKLDLRDGFSVTTTREEAAAPASSTEARRAEQRKRTDMSFVPPSLVRYQFAGGSMQMLTYAVPVGEGRSRLFFCMTVPRAGAPWYFRMLELRPSWLAFMDHWGQNIVLDGDTFFLHQQERELRLRRKGDWRSSYFMPASADRAVASLRRWLNQFGRPDYPSAGAPEPELTRAQILDRYSQHVVHCPNCRAAVTWIGSAKVLAQVVVAACLLAACALVGGRAPGAALPWLQLALVGAAAGLAGLGSWALAGAQKKFYFMDYVHADRN